MRFVNIVSSTRYLVLIPILGLAITAAVLFVVGGVGLIVFVFNGIGLWVTGNKAGVLPVYGLLDHVDQFLIGTVLYITAMGLYQLFIHDLNLPQWLETKSAAQLETNIVGVIVVVLGIEFLGAVIGGRQTNLFLYGSGIALPIAALALFLGVRHWTNRDNRIIAQAQDSAERLKSNGADEPLQPIQTDIDGS